MRYQLRHIQKWTAKIEIIRILGKLFLLLHFLIARMENRKENHPIAGLLVRWRKGLLAVMASLAVVGIILIPRTRINNDVTSNLPDSSQMRQGISILEKDFPLMDIRMQTLRVLFYAEPPADSLRDAIAAIPNVMRYMGTEQNGDHTLYQFTLPQDANGQEVITAIEERFGDRVLVEIDDNSHMPEIWKESKYPPTDEWIKIITFHKERSRCVMHNYTYSTLSYSLV